MIRFVFLFAFVAAFAAASVIDADIDSEISDRQVNICGSRCEFRLCRASGIPDDARPKGTRVLLRDANVAAPPLVCLPGTDLGKIRATGQAMAAAPGKELRPISRLNVSPKLSPRFFGLREVNFPVLPGEFGLTHLPTTTRQWRSLNDLCVVIPITKYDINKPYGVVETVNSNSPTSCVSFTASAPRLLIEFTWDSSDDFDLVLQEPGSSGEEISRFNRRSAAGGKLNSDNNIGECDIDRTGKEQIAYVQSSNPPNGEYTVKGLQFNNCGNGASRWNLAVISDGLAIMNKSGFANGDNEEEAFSFTFNL